MSGFVRQATASQARALGPFVSSADFKTPLTGLTIANTDIKLVVNGAVSANKNSGGGTHRVNGVYSITWDATDTATVGEIEVSVVVAGALPVFEKVFVLEAVVYDALFADAAPGYGVAQSGDSYPLLDTEVAALLARLGGFTGTGLNTVQGYLEAIMRGDSALTPSDVGGTYDNEVHSLEALEENQPFIII